MDKKINDYWELFLNSNSKEESDEAFASIYFCCVDELVSYGVGMGLDTATGEDLIHDMFVDLYIKRTRLKKITSISPYLFRTLRNKSLNLYKKKSRQMDIEDAQLSFSTKVTVLDSLISDEKKEKIRTAVEELLDSLTSRQREVVYLRFMQNMEYEDIAAILDMQVGSVRKLVYRSVSILRKKSVNLENPLVFIAFLSVLAKQSIGH